MIMNVDLIPSTAVLTLIAEPILEAEISFNRLQRYAGWVREIRQSRRAGNAGGGLNLKG